MIEELEEEGEEKEEEGEEKEEEGEEEDGRLNHRYDAIVDADQRVSDSAGLREGGETGVTLRLNPPGQTQTQTLTLSQTDTGK